MLSFTWLCTIRSRPPGCHAYQEKFERNGVFISSRHCEFSYAKLWVPLPLLSPRRLTMVASVSFQSLRLRLIQAKKRSTTHRLGWTAKPT